MSRELPLYQGATPQAPQQQMQGSGFTPQVQPMGGMLDAAVQSGFMAVEQYAELKDFGSSQQVEYQRRLNDKQMREEFENKMRIPWGEEGSFYDSEGNRKEDEVKAFIGRWQEENNKIPRPFWLAKNAMRDEGDLMQANSALETRVSLMTLDTEAKNRKQAFLDNYDLAIEQKDWPGAYRAIARAEESNQITRARGDEMRLQVDKTSFSLQFADLAATNPSGAYDLLYSEEYKNLFSPAEREEMRRRLAARRDSDGNNFYRSFVLTKPDSGNEKGSGKKSGNALAQSGLFTGQEIRWGTLMQAGKGHMIINEIRAEAINEARSFDPSLSDEGMELKREKFMDKYLRYESIGISKDFLNRQWKAADDLRKSLKTPNLNVKDRLDVLEKSGLLQNQGAFNAAEQEFYNAAYDDSGKWNEGGEYYNRFLGEFDYGGKTGKDLYNRYIAEARKKYAAGLKAQITERFHSWRENEGKDATQAEQQAKLIGLTREITGNKDISFEDEGPSLMDQAREWSKTAQKSKFDTLVAKQGKAIPWDFSQQEPPMQRVSVGFDTSRKDLPDGILLPRSMMNGVKEGEDAVMLTFDNKHLKVATVVGVCEGDSPKLTYAAAQRWSYNAERSYSLDMRILKENEAQPLLKAQEAALPSGKSVKINKSALGGLAPYEQAFIDAGKKYGMTPDQVKIGMSIAMHETGRGSSHAFRNKNNAMGISPNGGGPRSFGSVEEGIDYGMRNLKKNYFDKGLTTLEQIGAVYAPIGANNDPGNLNRYWTKGVRKSYDSISL